MTKRMEGHKQHLLQLRRRNGPSPTKKMMRPGKMQNAVYNARAHINSTKNSRQELTNPGFGNNKPYRDTVNPRK